MCLELGLVGLALGGRRGVLGLDLEVVDVERCVDRARVAVAARVRALVEAATAAAADASADSLVEVELDRGFLLGEVRVEHALDRSNRLSRFSEANND